MNPNLSTWPTEAEAAHMIGCSVRTLQRYAQDGRVEIRPRKRDGRKPENVCNPRDVERLLPAAHVMPEEVGNLPMTAVVQPNGKPAQADAFFSFISAITTAIATRQNVAIEPAQPQKLWLNLEEACAYSGLGVSALLAAVAEGKIAGGKYGPHGALAVHRASLEEYRG